MTRYETCWARTSTAKITFQTCKDQIIASRQTAARPLNIALWAAQLLVATPFVFFGAMKLVSPIATLSPIMPWTGQVPELMVRALGVVDVAGGLGLILPGLTGIRPDLVRLAAIGSIALQIAAGLFHLSRGEAAMVPLNLLLLALLAFILWGRTTKGPIVRTGVSRES